MLSRHTLYVSFMSLLRVWDNSENSNLNIIKVSQLWYGLIRQFRKFLRIQLLVSGSTRH